MTNSQLPLACLLICLIFSPLQAAQARGHVLRGKVYLPNDQVTGQPIAVKLLDSGALLTEVYTDSSGTYSFTGVQNGTYELVVEGDGRNYERTSVDVQIFSRSNENVQIFTSNIRLLAKMNMKDTMIPGVVNITTSIPKDAKKKYEKGVKSAQNNKSQEAIEHFQAALQLHAAYYEAHLALGQEYLKIRDFSAAEKELQQAIALNSQSAPAYLNLGMVLVKSGNHSQAIDPLRQALKLGEKKVATYMFLGFALMETENNTEAEEMLLKAHEIGGETQPNLRLILANFYNRTGNRAKTLQHLEAYVHEAPNANNVEEIRQLIKRLHTQN
jgi:Tfp pilus assembly protein PilF